jgi:ATP-dependent DNA helicase PIF1
MLPTDFELSPEFTQALATLESGVTPLFLTGRAGTGKSTLLTLFREQSDRQIAVVAPTGVAALNVGGQTIHSFFKFRIDSTPQTVKDIKLRSEQLRLFRRLQTLVIDEVSMLRADLLDCIDEFLKLHGPRKGQPFGGVQMIFIGDLYQLPPVTMSHEREFFTTTYASPYFFDAHCLSTTSLTTVELSHIYRQHDERFITILNAIRENDATSQNLDDLNTRFHNAEEGFHDDLVITLTSTNDLADRVNEAGMRALDATSYTYDGRVTGTFGERDLPTKQSLTLKPGAQVMLLNNEPNGRWVNGSLGRVVDIYGYGDKSGTEQVVAIDLANGTRVEVTPFTWEQIRYTVDPETDKLDTETIGSFTQFPLRLAWAVTIHKAQGKTFDQVIIDVGRGTFAHGQMYVALSRCRTLEGIRLRQPVEPRHIFMDRRVLEFMGTKKDRP